LASLSLRESDNINGLLSVMVLIMDNTLAWVKRPASWPKTLSHCFVASPFIAALIYRQRNLLFFTTSTTARLLHGDGLSVRHFR